MKTPPGTLFLLLSAASTALERVERSELRKYPVGASVAFAAGQASLLLSLVYDVVKPRGETDGPRLKV